MRLSVKIFMVNGLELDDTTSAFASVEEAVAKYGQIMKEPLAVVNWHTNDGPVYALASRHIVGFFVSEA